MSKIIIFISLIIAYGIYCQVNNGTDLFTMFWSLVAKFLGG